MEPLLAWCRETLASCRRPFGIDHFDLAVAVSDGDEGRKSASFRRLRPLALYGEHLESQLQEVLRGVIGRGPVYVSVALYSWGDAAHEAFGGA